MDGRNSRFRGKSSDVGVGVHRKPLVEGRDTRHRRAHLAAFRRIAAISRSSEAMASKVAHSGQPARPAGAAQFTDFSGLMFQKRASTMIGPGTLRRL
jgi:hypothetical protein